MTRANFERLILLRFLEPPIGVNWGVWDAFTLAFRKHPKTLDLLYDISVVGYAKIAELHTGIVS
jgi:hypothetical protein